MLRLYDTRHRQIEEIRPASPGVLRVYSCGPTVYRDAHVGNMRAYLLGDLIYRVAELQGLRVDWVVNITDVGHVTDDVADEGEDKILAQSRREGKSIQAVALFYEQRFHADLAALNIRPAAAYPRASEYIPRMIGLVEALLAGGHAYIGRDGTVYFDARSFPGYGALSGNRLEDLRPAQSAAREETKRFHADWALWKPTEPDAPVVFDSPWGPGFPGWHLECSAMSMDLFGESIDIHTGGIDLRFPHHEDERAQTESAAGHEVVHHWVHNEHLLFEGRKMAKSTGNVVLVSDLPARGLDPLALRLALLRTRYRQQTNLSWELLEGADGQLTRWRRRVAGWAESPSSAAPRAYTERLAGSLTEDLDTPAALITLQELEKDPEIADGAKFEVFAWADRVLGLDLARQVGAAPLPIPAAAQRLLADRERARAERRWADADRLRDELHALGVGVSDTPEGQLAVPL